MSESQVKDQPTWQRNFPIRQSEEHAVSRRQFATFCGCSALALAAGIPLKQKLLALPAADEPITVGRVAEIPAGTAVQFTYPSADHPCILVRLSADEFVAYSSACTHLMCPVHYEDSSNQFVCPCHNGFFDAKDGSVIAGPPRRALPRYEVNLSAGEILVGPNLMPNSPAGSESV
jgi:Rieske Fe-S protein